jgi:hypothetical protein
MNIFLPYENDINKSIESLDDRRLNKQIVECKQLLSLATDELINKIDISKRGYRNHPIYTHYKYDLKFLSLYGYNCCLEYKFRFNKEHSMHKYFDEQRVIYNGLQMHTTWVPYYMEGSKGHSNYIRTTNNVSSLYQRKLVDKWINSKYNIKWTNRNIPKFFSQYVKNNWTNFGTFGGKDL